VKTRLYRTLFRVTYLFALFAAGVFVLAKFVLPAENVHSGINGYYRSRFIDMVGGTAYRPFVYRTLLPATVRLNSLATPDPFSHEFNQAVRKGFGRLFFDAHWETTAAYEYCTALALMLAAFMGFGHFAAKLVMLTCSMRETGWARLPLAVSALLGLPLFFRYTSYIYDPPQLLLFTMALYFLAGARLRAFAVTFVLCCINKETAVLLIPLFALTGRDKCTSQRQFRWLLLAFAVGYLAIKSLITFVYRHNPGAFVEYQLEHNLELFSRGLTLKSAAIMLVIAFLLFYRWKEKPAFLKISFVCILPPLVSLALFLGYMDEWRGYYEAYPIALGLGLDTLQRIWYTL